MRWTVAEIVDAVDGRLAAGPDAALVDSVTQDSREAGPGALFVALVADRDGHDFAAAAADAGATAVLSSRPAAELDGLGPETAVIEVADTEVALADLGVAGRGRLGDIAVVGITGSVGKTTTKDLVAAVLATDRPTHASTRSFNNEIGVPLTVVNAPDTTQVLVLEMGARGKGHIRALCAVGRPTVGVVTSVGIAHTSEFGSVDAVADAKAELVEELPAAGTAVLNAANPLVAAMAERTAARVRTFGVGGDVRAEEVRLDEELVPRFRLVCDEGALEVTLGARGLHLVDNALAAATVGLVLGVPLERVGEGLAHPMLSPHRMTLARTATGARVLDDAYNANPMSTEAALRSLAALPAGRRVAVLGVMAELGDVSAAEHSRIGELAVALGIELIAVAAPDYLGTVDPEAPAALAADIDEALLLLSVAGPLSADDAVLVKGSRVAGLERLAARLLDGAPDG